MLCIIALLYQVLERCSRRRLMNGKFPNLGIWKHLLMVVM